MGNSHSMATDVPIRVLQAEIAGLNQGESCEMEILPEGHWDDCDDGFETDCLDLYRRCRKKSEHDRFIPICSFRLEDLPVAVRYPTIFKLIKDVAGITVKLKVRYTSKDRPKRFRCAKGMRVGTGYVDRKGSFDQWSGSVGTTFIIQTAAHVVFDNQEAEHTVVEFFFDDDDDRSGVVKARGVRILGEIDKEKDYCQFICQLYNSHEGDKVTRRLRQDEDYSTDNGPMPRSIDLAWCVSHPHGTAQKVSIGATKLIKIKKPAFKSGIFKMLLYSCCFLSNINEKKVFHFYFNEMICLEIEDYFTPSFVSMIVRHKASILSHLEAKGLVIQPTGSEKRQIQTEFQQQLYNCKMQMEEKFAEMAGHQSLNHVQEKVLKMQILKEIIDNLGVKLNAPDAFVDQQKKLFEEIILKIAETGFGRQLPVSAVSTIDSTTYSVPTCPGSSGAQVNAIVLNPSGFKFFSATHSFGGSVLGNRSGFGSSFSM